MKVLFACLFPLFQFFRIPQFIRRMLEEERAVLCAQRSVVGAGSCFGAEAIVHNNTGDKKRVKIGQNSRIDGELLVHDYGGQIVIGDFSYIGKDSRVWSGEETKIGNHVFVAHGVTITDSNSHQISAQERAKHFLRTNIEGKPFEKGSIKTAPVVIGDHAWINFGVGILKGVKIGEGAIIGAGSLVTKDIPPYTLAAGNPIRIIKEIPRS